MHVCVDTEGYCHSPPPLLLLVPSNPSSYPVSKQQCSVVQIAVQTRLASADGVLSSSRDSYSRRGAMAVATCAGPLPQVSYLEMASHCLVGTSVIEHHPSSLFTA